MTDSNLKQLFRRQSDGQLVAKDEIYPSFYGIQFFQTEASTIWYIPHYISKNCIYNFFDNNNQKIIPDEIKYIDNCNTEVLFNYAVSGFANLIFLVNNENTIDNCEQINPNPTPSVTPSSSLGTLNTPFDYALIKYSWYANDGTDLDTRTAITTPPRDIDVGWSRATTDGSYLTWGGDNTSSIGSESVIVNFNQLEIDYPSINEFVIRMRCNWYGSRLDGNVIIEFQTFLGGTMQQQGTDFINVGGTLINDITISSNCTSVAAANVDGSDVGTLTYIASTKTAYFTNLAPAVSITPTPTPSITPSQ